MRIVVFGSPSEMALGRMCARGFESLGHKVEYFSASYRTLPIIGPINDDVVHQRFIKTVEKVGPDLVLVIKGYELDLEAVQRVKQTSDTTVVNWNPDNPFQVRSQASEATTYLNALPAYDFVFTWGEFLIERLENHDAQCAEYLPFGWDPELHLQTESVDQYECDVVFLGIRSKKRERFLSVLSDFDFDLWGNYWLTRCWDLSLRRCHRGSKLSGGEYAKAMSSAKIVINIVADHNVPAHNMRTFEVPATESVLATTRTPGQQEFFKEDQDVVMFETPDELRKKVSYYLDNERERKMITTRGRKAIVDHTYADRMRSIINLVESKADT